MNNPSLDPFDEMNARSREVFRTLVESYLSSGDPIGSPEDR
jgi:heat-inducible transcriptional repressor